MIYASVCMATYNGSAFVQEQIFSILMQLGPDDELIIVDDASKDGTLATIKGIVDPRIRLFANSENQGINRTFERALHEARGKYIFLSDQDDIWLEGRLSLMTDTLENLGVDLVVSNFRLIDEVGNALPASKAPQLRAADSKSHWGNIGKLMRGRANYYGCAMAFRASFTAFILPFSTLKVGHDLWIAIAANVRGSIYHIEDETIAHRLHGRNATVSGRPLFQKVLSRVRFAFLVLHALRLKHQKG